MIVLRIWVGLIFLLVGCGKAEQSVRFEAVRTPTPIFPHPDSVTHLTGEQLAYRYCQTCHAFPEPGLLPKTVWAESVLPRMGHWLGIRGSAQEPYRGMSMYDDYIVRRANIFPDEPKIADESWKKLVAYYTQHAPDSLSKVNTFNTDTSFSQFQIHPIQLPTLTVPTTTLTHIDTATGHLWLGDALGGLYEINHQQDIVDSVKLDSPPADLHLYSDGSYQVLTMGIMNPADQAKGKLWHSGVQDSLVSLIPADLRRPVHFTSTTFGGKEVSGWLIAEFGNYLGQLTYYESSPKKIAQKQVLIDSPGARRIEVADINQDGFLDVTVLVAQGDERIITWYNQGDGHYRPSTILRFPPVHGSSYFELADFNDDNLLDILYTNGDNADYSPVLKPYHGIRIFLQSTEGIFQESYFQAMPGASKAMARDFDQDGDLDIAAISFFPDFEDTPERGFLYLENQSSGNTADFLVKTFPEAANGHWLTMDAGDTDQDGDLDIILGSFALPPSRVPDKLSDFWTREGPNYMILENTTSSLPHQSF